jgi:hypothetical protein
MQLCQLDAISLVRWQRLRVLEAKLTSGLARLGDRKGGVPGDGSGVVHRVSGFMA